MVQRLATAVEFLQYVDYGLNEKLTTAFCAEDNFFQVQQNFSLNIGNFFHFARRNKNVFKLRTQVCDMTELQRYSHVESAYNSVITAFVPAIALLKSQIQADRFVL